jgi:hypothetical protein
MGLPVEGSRGEEPVAKNLHSLQGCQVTGQQYAALFVAAPIDAAKVLRSLGTVGPDGGVAPGGLPAWGGVCGIPWARLQ